MTHTTESARAVTAPGPRLTDEIGLETALVRLSHVVQRVFGEVSRDHDLTAQQAQLLCRLVDGPVGMADLGRMLDLEKSSLTGLVDRAEKRGLVVRTRSNTDRRVYQISLTSDGLQVGTATHDGVIARLGELLGDIDEPEREQLTARITRMIAAAEDHRR
ncbi:MarR family winged helix-turn-helix transcriptional regulator [Prauserella alba]|uniref:MarR family transcriptional regulator n=1 Tax=Prauserella alba TaxID=176898 RepID=A0ABP4FYM5_9PSEU|nr:MarR family transcriptional regulator [Prauserella alba]MCP2182227.1 DNA-binding transcriptional regulator, MarR family [Prauserella alba]